MGWRRIGAKLGVTGNIRQLVKLPDVLLEDDEDACRLEDKCCVQVHLKNKVVYVGIGVNASAASLARSIQSLPTILQSRVHQQPIHQHP